MSADYVNIHTHKRSSRLDCIELVNVDYPFEMKELGLISAGIHPWAFDSDFDFTKAIHYLEQNINRLAAIGEVGLDKMHPASFDKQLQALQIQIELSERFKKPLIIHNVHADAELLQIRQSTHAKQTWIVHGFSGGVQQAQQFIRHGFMLSVGFSLLNQNSKINKAITTIPIEDLFFETDIANVAIEDIYHKAAAILNRDENLLRTMIFANFDRVFNTDNL